MTLNINQIKETIKNLDKETVLKLVEILAGLSKKPIKKPKTKTKPTTKKRGRPPKKKIKEVETEENIIIDEDESAQEVAPRRRKPKALNKTRSGDKGSPGYIEKFKPIKNRPNLFFEKGFDKLHKEDTIIDKKLNKNRKPVERGERNNLIDVECRECGKEDTVREDLVYSDEDGVRWVCDRCIGSGK